MLSIAIMRNPEKAGSVEGLHLVVSDLDAARAELVQRGVEVSEMYHFEPDGQKPGPDPQRSDYNSFVTFKDPDGTVWLVQEVKRGAGG